MKLLPGKLLSIIVACAAATAASPTFAALGGGVALITYGPAGSPGPASAVPTLGGSLLIALAVLLALVSLRLLKHRPPSGTGLVIAITAAGALATGAGGVKLVAEARAAESLVMSSSGGGSLYVPSTGTWQVFNSTGDTLLRILEIEVVPGCYIVTPELEAEIAPASASFAGTCSTSTTLAPGYAEYCDISVSCDA